MFLAALQKASFQALQHKNFVLKLFLGANLIVFVVLFLLLLFRLAAHKGPYQLTSFFSNTSTHFLVTQALMLFAFMDNINTSVRHWGKHTTAAREEQQLHPGSSAKSHRVHIPRALWLLLRALQVLAIQQSLILYYQKE